MDANLTNAAIYSINNGTELTYELKFCKDYKVRAIVMANGMMRVEVKKGKEWKASKPYIVKKNKKRVGDRIVEEVKKFLEE